MTECDCDEIMRVVIDCHALVSNQNKTIPYIMVGVIASKQTYL